MRRDIMGLESTSKDDRYTMVDGEAIEDACMKMEIFSRGFLTEDRATRIATLLKKYVN